MWYHSQQFLENAMLPPAPISKAKVGRLRISEVSRVMEIVHTRLGGTPPAHLPLQPYVGRHS
jgi:hypothetical protein